MNFFYSEFFSCFNGKIIDGNFSKINDVFCGKEIVSYLKFTQFSRIFYATNIFAIFLKIFVTNYRLKSYSC